MQKILSNDSDKLFGDPCLPFQMDLSCLVDEELHQDSVSRALLHIEACDGCREFWNGIRGQVFVHKQLADPNRIRQVLDMLEATSIFPAEDPRGPVRKLAAIFFQLGQAYLMLVLDQKFQFKLYEQLVPIDDFKVHGSKFVERMIRSRGHNRVLGDYNLIKARELLDGKLESIAENLEKGKVLLEESLILRPKFAEPRLFLALYYRHQREFEQAKELLQWVLQNGTKSLSKARAAIQLAGIYGQTEDFRQALRYSRWVLQGSWGNRDSQFIATYNTAIYYAQLHQYAYAMQYFWKIANEFPDNLSLVAESLQRSQIMSKLIQSEKYLAAELAKISPVLVQKVGG